MKFYELTSTFFSDGTRKLSVNFSSSSGERTVLFELEDAIKKILEGYEINPLPGSEELK